MPVPTSFLAALTLYGLFFVGGLSTRVAEPGREVGSSAGTGSYEKPVAPALRQGLAPLHGGFASTEAELRRAGFFGAQRVVESAACPRDAESVIGSELAAFRER
jgi:hypothetical protein